ncbi:MAG: hypothetical protein JWN17_1277, partial [Frankiales bacterium]|nr:hypothetical protein [Frankiales bacterium]
MASTRLPALLVGTGLVLGSGVALAPGAWAAGSVTAPGTGTVYASDQRVGLSARVDARSGATQLHLVEPGGADHTVDSAGASLVAQTLTFAFDTDCPAYPGTSCAGRRPARNGTWTVRLTGGATATSTFSLRVPPAAPQGVQARATSPRQVVVTWDRGTEPDLTGYSLTTADGRRLADGDSSCSDGTCRTVLTYDTDGPSTDSVVVRAERACPDCDADLTASSAPVSVDRPAPPAPAATPDSQPSDGAAPATSGGATSGSGTPSGAASGGPSAPSGGTGSGGGSSPASPGSGGAGPGPSSSPGTTTGAAGTGPSAGAAPAGTT